MPAVFCDTSAWYALMNPHDAHHAKAKGFLEAHPGTLITSNYVVAETANLVHRRLGINPAREFLGILNHTALVEVMFVTPQQHDRIAEFFTQRENSRMSFTDCSSVVLIREQRLEAAFCFDADFQRAGIACVP